MSALQDILDKMYVDPELLEHLAEEQKLLLFIKMREEQIRRWKLNEEKAEREERLNSRNRKKGDSKRVQWRSGADGNVWVWVMGEHPDDLSIDDILAREAKEKARELAEKEILIESMRLDGSITENLDEEQLKNQLMEMQIYPGGNSESKNCVIKNPRASPYDDLDAGNNNDVVNNSDVTVRQSRQSLPPNFKESSTTIENVPATIRKSYEPTTNSQIFSLDLNNGRQPAAHPSSNQHNVNNDFQENVKPPIVPRRPLMSGRRSEGNFIGDSSRLGNPNEDFVQFTRTYVPGGATRSNGFVGTTSSTTLSAHSTSPFPVGGQQSHQTPSTTIKSPIASTTVFSSFAHAPPSSTAYNSSSNDNNNSSGVANNNNTKLPSEQHTTGGGGRFGGFNVGGGRVTRMAARLSGGGTDFGRSTFYTAVTTAVVPSTTTTSTMSIRQQPSNSVSNGEQQLSSGGSVVTTGVVAAGIGRFSMGSDGDRATNSESSGPLFRRAHSASRIFVPSTSKQLPSSDKMVASGEYDNHPPQLSNANYKSVAVNSGASSDVKASPTGSEKLSAASVQQQVLNNNNPIARLHSALRNQQLLAEDSSRRFTAGKPTNSAVNVTLRAAASPREKVLKSVDNSEIEKRQSRILEQILEERDKMEREAEAEEQRQRQAWEEQEKKAREAEAQIRLIAQKARQEHLKSLRTSSSLLPVLSDTSSTSLKDAIKNLPRPPKPKNRNAIVQWYRNVELPKRTGFDPNTFKPAVWFHGIISRALAEELLVDKPAGSFLVRVSERIWGYTISYVVKDAVTKHFLVEKLADGYQFLGTNQIVHQSLYDLVVYHKSAPVTAKGKEILRHPIGQQNPSSPDYADIME